MKLYTSAGSRILLFKKIAKTHSFPFTCFGFSVVVGGGVDVVFEDVVDEEVNEVVDGVEEKAEKGDSVRIKPGVVVVTAAATAVDAAAGAAAGRHAQKIRRTKIKDQTWLRRGRRLIIAVDDEEQQDEKRLRNG
uniref:Uncharacterized protein n=1 Tax=Pristionchus pacificus TaxID=54126 RepID=A0A2A6BTQ1_PRIPA|eukprot:PDM69274.1 hypothetical protein PRIPAC_47576 [Pristionchus pacificus]